MKQIFLIGIVALFNSCNGGTSSETPTEDSTAEWRETPRPVRGFNSIGTWVAQIERSNRKTPDSMKFVVTGSVELEQQNAKVTLTKFNPKSNLSSELVLNLSKKVIKKIETPVAVSYTETIKSERQYVKVRIMYGDDTVAIIDSIGGIKH